MFFEGPTCKFELKKKRKTKRGFWVWERALGANRGERRRNGVLPLPLVARLRRSRNAVVADEDSHFSSSLFSSSPTEEEKRTSFACSSEPFLVSCSLSRASLLSTGRGERVSTPARTPETSNARAFVFCFSPFAAIDCVPSRLFLSSFPRQQFERMGRSSLQVVLSGMPPAQKRLLAVR